MTIRAKTLLITAVLGLVLAAAAGLYLVWFAPPLRPSSDYAVAYSVSGHSVPDVHLFRPLGMQGRYYISVPSAPDAAYHWFVVDFARHVVALPLFGVTCPCGSPCVHRDQALGVLLTSRKTEDTWSVVFVGDGVQFSNATLSFTLTRTP